MTYVFFYESRLKYRLGWIYSGPNNKENDKIKNNINIIFLKMKKEK